MSKKSVADVSADQASVVNESTPISLTKEDLIAIIAAASAQNTAALEKIVERTKPDPEIFYPDDNYRKDPRNIDPGKDLTATVRQHGIEIDTWGLKGNPATITQLNALIDYAQRYAAAGRPFPIRYCNGFVKVEILHNGDLNIDYPWSTSVDRVEQYSHFNGFCDLVQKMHEENKTRPITH